MHIDLIEHLRCPRGHEESSLVAAFDRMAGRHVVEGRLGCPVCEAEYPIVAGIARFDEGRGPDPRAPAAAAADEGEAMRAAALLGLADGRGVAMMTGSWSLYAAKIVTMVADVHLILLDPDVRPDASDSGTISAILAPGRLPLAAGALIGAALDEAGATPERLANAVRALRDGGRLVAPAAAPRPDGVAELARDERHWVAERRTAPRLLTLGRGGAG